MVVLTCNFCGRPLSDEYVCFDCPAICDVGQPMEPEGCDNPWCEGPDCPYCAEVHGLEQAMLAPDVERCACGDELVEDFCLTCYIVNSGRRITLSHPHGLGEPSWIVDLFFPAQLKQWRTKWLVPAWVWGDDIYRMTASWRHSTVADVLGR